jgi:Flp pilus assembly protein TadG
MKRLRTRKMLRLGAVAVEMAIVTPLLLAMLFGIIEFGWLFTVRSTMVNAAREGARLGALEGVTETEIRNRTSELLVPMHIDDNCSVSVTMPTDSNPTVTVNVSAPRSSVSLVGNFFGFTSGTITGSASMRREGM